MCTYPSAPFLKKCLSFWLLLKMPYQRLVLGTRRRTGGARYRPYRRPFSRTRRRVYRRPVSRYRRRPIYRRRRAYR